MIIVVLVVVAFVGMIVYSKFGSKLLRKKESSDDEAVDEELY
jgi:flagellar basal body-associated protein FliL